MDLYTNLKTLGSLIQKIVLDKYAAKDLNPILVPYVVFDTSFEEGGCSTKPKRISLLSWGKSHAMILDSLNKNPEFKLIEEFLFNCFEKAIKDDEKTFLFPLPNKIIDYMISCYLYNPNLDDNSIETLIRTLIMEIEGKPLKYEIKSELKGIKLDIDKIEINENIVLRKPKKKDLIKYFHSDILISNSGFEKKEATCPSAILEIKYDDTFDTSVFKLIDAIKMLRLYDVGYITCIQCQTRTESLNFRDNNLTTDVVCEEDNPLDSSSFYIIGNDDTSKIKRFWNIMVNLISQIPVEGPLSIAFDRYNASLKEARIGVFTNISKERRITEAVMGLEVLFLKDQEGKVPKKFRRRISKLMNSLEYNTHFSHEEFAEISYDIRSEFLHWGKIKKDTKKKIDGKFSNIDEFLKIVLDYLRVSIITFLLIKIEHEEFLDLMIASFNNKNATKHLSEILSDVKKII